MLKTGFPDETWIGNNINTHEHAGCDDDVNVYIIILKSYSVMSGGDYDAYGGDAFYFYVYFE